MQVVYSRCCGLDVHKDSLTACVLVFDEQGRRQVRKKEFPTYWQQLQRLKLWLYANKVQHVAMESTGVYWKPVWNILQGHFPLLVTNPYHMKNIPGRKTDQNDAEWIADLLAHGLLRGSFIPPPGIQELRDWTRYRVKLMQEYNRIHNRIHKVLEDANLKLSSVASDILGATGRAIIQAIIRGQEHPDWLADKAMSSLRNKRDQLRLVLKGRITDHHRHLLRELMDDVERVEEKICRVQTEIAERMSPYQELMDRLTTIPGVDILTAWTLIAELGPDMSVFPDADHAASWAGLVPGSFESAGKRKSSRTRHGNRWLRRALCQSAWAVAHKKDCYLTAHFYRRASRHGAKKAIVATAHQILIIVFHILRDGTVYREHGRRFRSHESRQNDKAAFEVILKPRPETAPPVPRRGRGLRCKCAERGIDCKHRPPE